MVMGAIAEVEGKAVNFYVNSIIPVLTNKKIQNPMERISEIWTESVEPIDRSELAEFIFNYSRKNKGKVKINQHIQEAELWQIFLDLNKNNVPIYDSLENSIKVSLKNKKLNYLVTSNIELKKKFPSMESNILGTDEFMDVLLDILDAIHNDMFLKGLNEFFGNENEYIGVQDLISSALDVMNISENTALADAIVTQIVTRAARRTLIALSVQ